MPSLAPNPAGLLLVLFTTGFGLYRINEHLARKNYDIAGANEDLGQILGEGAVVSAPYAPALTIDNKLKSFIHLFGVAEVDSTLLEREPITHLAIDESNWTEAVAQYPKLEGLLPITMYWIRDYGVRIYNISGAYGNERAMTYKKTEYEKAADLYNLREIDSALVTMERFLATSPNCRSANLIYIELLIAVGRFGAAERMLNYVTTRYPHDYYTNLVCGRSYQILGLVTRDRRLVDIAQTHYQKAVFRKQ